jgi:hypothetical protein
MDQRVAYPLIMDESRLTLRFQRSAKKLRLLKSPL